MKTSPLLLSLLCPWLALGQVELVPADTLPAVFSGAGRTVQVNFRNPTDQDAQMRLQTQLLQASAATTMPIGPAQPWKNLRVLAGQTVTESISLNFPEVKAGTRFIIKWMNDDAAEFGQTDVLVYPTGLLTALQPLAGGKSLGIYDPHNQLKPLLQAAKVDCAELEQTGWENFTGRLAIIGPFQRREQMPSGLSEKIQTLAKHGGAVVWIQPSAGNVPNMEPTLYAVRFGAGHVVVVPAKAVGKLAENPLSQLNLIKLAEFSLNPERTELPPLKP